MGSCGRREDAAGVGASAAGGGPRADVVGGGARRLGGARRPAVGLGQPAAGVDGGRAVAETLTAAVSREESGQMEARDGENGMRGETRRIEAKHFLCVTSGIGG